MDRTIFSGDVRAAALEVLGPGAALSEPRVRTSLSGAHVRFETLASDGTPVWDEDVAVHFQGAAPTLRARLVEERGRGVWSLAATRRVGEAQAMALAAAAAGGTARRAQAVARRAGPYLARPAWRVLVDVQRPWRLLEVWVDGNDGGVEVGGDLLWRVEGTGWVYRPNPVAVVGTEGLFDGNDGDSPLLTSLRDQVQLLGLDGSGFLRGDYADARNSSQRAQEISMIFDYTRSQTGFEEVNAYYHVDRVQRQLQELGYSGAKAILARPFEIVVNSIAEDQSVFDPGDDQIRTGRGGTDDGEDADVIIHEYGHAVQHDIVPGYGRSDDARAMGEAFGDILAYAMTEETGKVPVVARECLAAWDALAYQPSAECMRRVDGNKHYPEHMRIPRQPHYDGEMWSGMLHDLFQETGLGALGGIQLVLESTFLYGTRVTFAEAAEALLLADQSLHGGAHLDDIRRVLVRHGFLATITPPSTMEGPWTSVTSRPLVVGQVPHSADVSETYTSAGAHAMRVHFASIDMEVGVEGAACPSTFCDAIYLYDGEGRLYARLGGGATDVTSPAIPGDTVVVRWLTNSRTASAGFTIDRVEAIAATVPMPDAGPPPPPPDAGVPVTPTPGGEPSGSCACRAGARGELGPGPALLVLIAAAAAAGSRRRRSRS